MFDNEIRDACFAPCNHCCSASTAQAPVTLILPEEWNYKAAPTDNQTAWYGGYFNSNIYSTQESTDKQAAGYARGKEEGIEEGKAEALGEMGETCDDCPVVEVTKGTKTIKLYNPEKVEFKKE